MKISIKHVKIENFRVFETLDTDVWDKTLIESDNAVGKTSFASAILWALTGKSLDGESGFEIVPIGKYGEVSPSVELECVIGERPVTIKRVYEAKFTRDKKFSDYAVTTYINGIETGVRNLKNWISTNICNEQVFKILSNPKTFLEDCPKENKELKWMAQRRLLLSILGGQKTDSEIAQSDAQWEPIAEALKRYDNANQYLVFMKKKYADAQKALNDFDVRIAQQERNIVHTKHTESQIEELVNQTKEKAAEITKKNEAHKQEQRTSAADQIKAEIKELTQQKDSLIKQYNENMQILVRTKANYQAQADAEKKSCDECMQQIKVYVEALEKLRSTTVKEVCETCGQKLSRFAIENSQKKLQMRIKTGEQKTAQLREQIAKMRQKWEFLTKQINSLMEPTYPARVDDIQIEIERLTEELSQISEPTNMPEFSETMQKLSDFMENLKQEYIGIKRNKEVKEEIERIEEERKSAVKELSDAQKNLDLAKQFISEKCESSESAINDLFENVTFQLFEQNKSNDDVRETCILRYRGVKYDDLSYSTKIIAGLEVVKAFQKFYNITAPIFIDNAESITGNVETGAQTFFMKVREELCPECSGQSGRRNADGTWTCEKCGHVWKKKLEIREAL